LKEPLFLKAFGLKIPGQVSTAKVRIGDQEQFLAENQSVYIPIGEVHSLENPGKVNLELIEVQSGSYLGEDDIVRYEDRYGRA